MKVRDIVGLLGLTVYSGQGGLDNLVTGGYTSDLLSDVMGNIDEGRIWITLQTHKNIMAIASLKEAAAVIIVKGYKPEENTLAQSNEENIPILGTDLQSFEISGQLYEALKSELNH